MKPGQRAVRYGYLIEDYLGTPKTNYVSDIKETRHVAVHWC